MKINQDTTCTLVNYRLSQLLKGAVVVNLCQNEADVKCQMDIDSHISLTEQAGKIRLTELTHQFEILHLPHSGIGSCQLLLSMTDTFEGFTFSLIPNNMGIGHGQILIETERDSF